MREGSTDGWAMRQTVDPARHTCQERENMSRGGGRGDGEPEDDSEHGKATGDADAEHSKATGDAEHCDGSGEKDTMCSDEAGEAL